MSSGLYYECALSFHAVCDDLLACWWLVAG